MAISTGWTLDYVSNNVDLPRLASLNKCWRDFPPVHVMVSAYMGYKAPAETEVKDKSEKQEDILAEMMANVPQYKFQPPVIKDNGL